VWIPHGRTREELDKLASVGMLKFYLRRRQIWLGVLNFFHAPFPRAMRYFLGGLSYFARSLVANATAGTRY